VVVAARIPVHGRGARVSSRARPVPAGARIVRVAPDPA